MTTTVLLVAVVVVAFIGRSANVCYHRQARLNALRDDLAQFFASIDAAHSRTPSQGGETNNLERQQKARADALLNYRRILLRLNMNEPPHRRLEKALEALLLRNKSLNQDELTAAITLARTVLNEEWNMASCVAPAELIAAFNIQWKRMHGVALPSRPAIDGEGPPSLPLR
jgi:hypothetical protein